MQDRGFSATPLFDPEYCRMREGQERDNAARTGDSELRAIHLAMAERYARLLRDAPEGRAAA